MKILHVNTGQQGGSAWCAVRISRALASEGIESRMLFADGKTLPEGIEGDIAKKDKNPWNRNGVLRRIKNQLVKMPQRWFMDAEKMRYQLNQANTQRLYLHQPMSDYKNISHHPLVGWADIIHLHWVPDFVDYPTFFRDVKKPIVWTLHDKYPAEGVQHYSSEFYPIPNELRTLDSACRMIKRKGVLQAKSLNVVAISEMMVDICNHSDVLGGFPVTLIHNGVDTTAFLPYDKRMARKELGIVSDANVFLFSSYVISDGNKGLERLVSAIERAEYSNKILMCIGNIGFNQALPKASFPIIPTGPLTDSDKMSRYYSAADFFIQSSYEESFGQTVLEAMACGTPVISTPCGVSPDLIRPFNGVLCDGFDSDAILNGINKALSRQYDSSSIRQYIVDNYQYDIIAKQYIELYKRILSDIDSSSS